MKIMNEKIFSRFAPLLLAAVAMTTGCRSVQPPVKVARVAPEDTHAQKLVANAFHFIDPAHGLIDPASGYPAEGWNQDPKRGLFLHAFTQLTAIGERVELLACIAAGQADNPYLSHEQALAELEKIVKSLRADQVDPTLSDRGLLCNFLAFEGDRRLGPLTTSVPAWTSVAPVAVLVPVRISVALPVLVTDPSPLITPAKVLEPNEFNTKAELFTMPKLKSDPSWPLVPSPSCKVPPLMVVAPL